MSGRISRDPVFSAEGHRSSAGVGMQVRLLVDDVDSAFPLPTTASPTLQGALQNGFEEAVVAREMPESCQFLSPDD